MSWVSFLHLHIQKSHITQLLYPKSEFIKFTNIILAVLYSTYTSVLRHQTYDRKWLNAIPIVISLLVMDAMIWALAYVYNNNYTI